jgi:hypothetical protein
MSPFLAAQRGDTYVLPGKGICLSSWKGYMVRRNNNNKAFVCHLRYKHYCASVYVPPRSGICTSSR